MTNNNHGSQPDHEDFGGLTRDLPFLLNRRDAMKWLGGASLGALLAACGIDGRAVSTTGTPATTPPVQTGVGSPVTPQQTSTTIASATTGAPTPGVEIPDESAGPFPADGSNGPNVLTDDGAIRADLTSSFGSLTGTAAGVPLNIEMTIVEAENGTALAGAVVYLWHCTADGRYSVYEVTDQNYLRGAQETDSSGRITFTSIFPGCYRGRWPHAHFEVYESLDAVSSSANAIKTSQLALPEADCQVVYQDDRYIGSANNLSQLSLASDNVFRDGWSEQLATISSRADGGIVASLLVRV
ncbi:MAG: intradiol ring-cleavage dioxygenase [Acidimicrobiia bacterium]|nr:intradiol ring-cleavage dioxygenase [Acidimicrobiia bacterium]NNL27250.1 intradiol ring-cleavage dioxygenase [Acidimicrobiia bacterium]